MKALDHGSLYSASDLLGFLGCQHRTFLDLVALQTPLATAQEDAQAQLLQEKGKEHEQHYLQHLRHTGLHVVEIPEEGALHDRVAQTLDAMRQGVDVVYQAALLHAPWHGFADFLRRVDRPSALEAFSYEAVDTKLAHQPAPEHVLQLCVYSDLLAHYEGVRPTAMHLVLGDGQEVGFRTVDFWYYYLTIKQRFAAYVASPPAHSKPEPCALCALCQWQAVCEAAWERYDHLSLVADIRRSQTHALEAAGVQTVRALAQLPEARTVPGLSPEILSRLRAQARLHIAKRDTGTNQVEILPAVPGRGFARLPTPDPGDLFLDLEGDPLYPHGLEYLFGLYTVTDGTPTFRAFWAHDHTAEQRTFQEVIDVITAHLACHPGAHLYHYNHYEETALKRLASRYGTREAEVDDLLRRCTLVDLYKVVREAIRVSEPRYSLKNLETFYMATRVGEVTTASDSIVVYEQWRTSRDEALLHRISSYNEEDCRSTLLLRAWLLTLRPEGLPWREEAGEVTSGEQQQAQREAEARRATYEQRLLESCADPDRPSRALVAQLLEFHRREAKPQWWAMFDRQSRVDAELIEDAECLGGLQADPTQPPVQDKRSLVFTYRFPPQEYKFRPGDTCRVAATLTSAGTIVDLDAAQGTVRLKRGAKSGPLPDALSVIPDGPLSQKVLHEAIYRFADAVIAGEDRFAAVKAFLCRSMPVIVGHPAGMPIVPEGEDLLAATSRVVTNLRQSCLFIQGPPGTGKTYVASHVIVALLRAGHKVGISSNSHKAINNLLAAVEQAAKAHDFRFYGQKKSTANQPDTLFHGDMIENVTNNDGMASHAALIAGTAWLFARAECAETLDYLFLDEAGQVSLANFVAMGTSARNIVLVGDQMQLGQPIQGVHPGESGASTLDYLLQEHATIAPERGIFLRSTWRMHESICQFISEAVYDGCLRSAPETQQQALLLRETAHPTLVSHGIRFVPVAHTGCAQKSEVEGAIIRDLYTSLMQQEFRNRDGAIRQMRPENVLIVTPYNVQVTYLRSLLPTGARVGTVDLFQGQEAEVVLISMVTSSGDDIPRNIEFLYSKHRLNVAISRARTLAVMVASPRLLDIACHTIEQMRLVNTLCWVKAYAESDAFSP
jgi:predicted RecB family nuclease